MRGAAEPLLALPNIGRTLADNLKRAGIHTPKELRRIGSQEAFVRVLLHADREACLNQLCALEGAVQGIRWFNLSQEEKAELRQFYGEIRGRKHD